MSRNVKIAIAVLVLFLLVNVGIYFYTRGEQRVSSVQNPTAAAGDGGATT